MKKIALGVAFLCVWGATTAGEFTLQFPVSAGNHKTLRVAGYAIDALGATGPCDRSYTSGGSGRGGRYITHRYYGQCKWDLRGNYLGGISLPAPLPTQLALATTGDHAIYAYGPNKSYTGTAGARGFVVSLNTLYAFAPQPTLYGQMQVPVTFTEQIKSTGDFPLTITDVTVKVTTASGVAGVAGTVTINRTDCRHAVLSPGQSCSITATYLLPALGIEIDNPTSIGQAVQFDAVTNANAATPYTQALSIALPAS